MGHGVWGSAPSSAGMPKFTRRWTMGRWVWKNWINLDSPSSLAPVWMKSLPAPCGRRMPRSQDMPSARVMSWENLWRWGRHWLHHSEAVPDSRILQNSPQMFSCKRGKRESSLNLWIPWWSGRRSKELGCVPQRGEDLGRFFIFPKTKSLRTWMLILDHFRTPKKFDEFCWLLEFLKWRKTMRNEWNRWVFPFFKWQRLPWIPRLGKAAFFELRYEDDGVTERKEFVLNQAGHQVTILRWDEQGVLPWRDGSCDFTEHHAFHRSSSQMFSEFSWLSWFGCWYHCHIIVSRRSLIEQPQSWSRETILVRMLSCQRKRHAAAVCIAMRMWFIAGTCVGPSWSWFTGGCGDMMEKWWID